MFHTDSSLKAELIASLNSPLARRYIFLTVTFGAFLAIFITFFEAYIVYGQQHSGLIKTQQEIASLAVPTISRAAWSFNDEIVKTTLRSIIDNGSIDFAKYESETQSLIFGERSPYSIITGYDVHANFKSTEIVIGHLELSTSRGAVVVPVLEMIAVSLITNFAKTIVLVLFSFLVFHQLVNRHLVLFASRFRQYGATNPDSPPLMVNRQSIASRHQPDELDELAAAFNAARSELAVRLEQRELAYEEVEQAAARYTEQLQRIDGLMRNVRQSFSFFLDDGSLFYSSINNFSDAFGAEKLLLKKFTGEKEVINYARFHDVDVKLITASNLEYNSELLQFELSDESRTWALYVVNSDAGAQAMLLSDVTDVSKQSEILTSSRRVAAIGTIAASVAHELNNGLAVLKGRTELLESWASRHTISDNSIEPLLDTISEINNEIRHLTCASRQILGFATNSDEGNIDFHHVNELGSLTDQVMADFVSADKNKLVDIRIDGYISVDLTQFLSSLRNLIKNANEATAPGGKIEVQFRVPEESEILDARLDRQESYMAIDIMDDGSGISKEMQSRLFSPFASTKPGGRGTGLGLWFVYNFVVKANGFINYRKNINQGSWFTLYLPVSYRTDEVSWKPDPDMGFGPEFISSAQVPKTPIVLVEDNEKMLDILKTYLESIGFCIIDSDTVEGAIAILDSHKNLGGLVCDLNLPDGLGSHVIDHYEAINGKGPKILMTGSLRLEGAESKVLNSAIVLSKPFSFKSLSQILLKTMVEEEDVCV